MEFKGTKGKWEVDIDASRRNEHNVLCTAISSPDSGGYKVEGLCEVFGDDIESKANALLISKAPEMLEMLKDLEEYLRQNTIPNFDEIMKLKQLIKEATEL